MNIRKCTKQFYVLVGAIGFFFAYQVAADARFISDVQLHGKLIAAAGYKETWAIEQAEKWFRYFQAGRVDDLAALSPEVRRQLTPDVLRRESQRLRKLGRPLRFSYAGADPAKGYTGFYVLIEFKTGRIIEALAYDAKGRITGIDFKEFEPTQRPKPKA